MRKIHFLTALVSFSAVTSSQTKMFINKTNGTSDSLWLSEIRSITFKTSNGVIPTQGLVAYYPFNGNANDESGNGNNGTLSGAETLTTDRFGHSNAAYLFNGVSSYIQVPHSVSLQPSSALSIAAWAKARDWGSGRGVCTIVDKGTDQQAGWYTLRYWSNPRQFEFSIKFATSSISYLYTTQAIASDSTYFVAGSYDGQTMKIYLDCVLQNSRLQTGTIPQNTSPLTIGRHNLSSAYYYLNGKVDDIRIYNRVLSESEINQLYHEGGW